jgi:cytoskeletal protein CcmA (bactofilin family)
VFDGFKVNSKSDADRTVLRLTQIKLDYVGLGSSAFICKDNEGRNILQNLIPFNYSTDGYSLVLNYNNGMAFVNVRWTISKSLVSAELGEPVDFGGALFDSKNGIITFYDVSGGDATIFNDISNNFYLDASKYIGKKGIFDLSGSFEVTGNLGVSGEAVFDNLVTINNNLDISNGNFTVDAQTQSTFLQGTLDVSGNMDLDGTLDVSGNTHLENRLDVSGAVVLDSTLNVTNDFNINSGKFTVDAETGNTFLQGTLDVSGDMDLDGTLEVSGNTHLENRLH